MKSKSKQISDEYKVMIFGFVVGVIFLLLDLLGVITFIRSGISFVMDPVYYEGNRLGSTVTEYLGTFVSLGEFREEYNRMSIDVYKKDVDVAFYAFLQEENEALRKQVSLGRIESSYVESKVLGGSNYNFLKINRGDSSGIKVGDIVQLGNMFVGIVVNADSRGSLVQLPTNKSSNLEVTVLRSGVEELRDLGSQGVLSKGVVEGSADGVKISNMSMSADLREGDVVVVNDVRVGEYLVLGLLVELSDNPAATSRSGFVAPLFDYDKLTTVFVRTDY